MTITPGTLPCIPSSLSSVAFPAVGLETRGSQAGDPHKPFPSPVETLSPDYRTDRKTRVDLTCQMETVLGPPSFFGSCEPKEHQVT